MKLLLFEMKYIISINFCLVMDQLHFRSYEMICLKLIHTTFFLQLDILQEENEMIVDKVFS